MITYAIQEEKKANRLRPTIIEGSFLIHQCAGGSEHARVGFVATPECDFSRRFFQREVWRPTREINCPICLKKLKACRIP